MPDFKGQHRCPIGRTASLFLGAQLFRDSSGAKAASLRRVSMRFKFWSQICQPTQFTLEVDRATGGKFGYLNWSMGNEPSTA
jgi:hypothetical protein